jgi:uncharacterized protein YdaU (DUF1376 family)
MAPFAATDWGLFIFMKDPAFLFYSKDWLSGCQFMDMQERGVYITLLAAQHQNGHLDPKRVGFLLGFGWDMVSDIVKSKFQTDADGLIYNERLDVEIAKRSQFINKQQLNGQKGGRPRKSETQTITQNKPNYKPKHKPNDNPIVNVDVNVNSNEFNKGVHENFSHYQTIIETELEVKPNEVNNQAYLQELLVDEIWQGSVMMMHRIKDQRLKDYLVTFYEHLITQSKQHQSVNKFRSHFMNWLNTQLSMNKEPSIKFEP